MNLANGNSCSGGGFIEVANEFGEIQLGFGEKFYKKGG